MIVYGLSLLDRTQVVWYHLNSRVGMNNSFTRGTYKSMVWGSDNSQKGLFDNLVTAIL